MNIAEHLCAIIDESIDHLKVSDETRYKICIDLLNRYITQSNIQFNNSECNLFKLAFLEMEAIAAGHRDNIKVHACRHRLIKIKEDLQNQFFESFEQEISNSTTRHEQKQLFIKGQLFETIIYVLKEPDICNVACDISQLNSSESINWACDAHLEVLTTDNPDDVSLQGFSKVPLGEVWLSIKLYLRIQALRYNIVSYRKAPL